MHVISPLSKIRNAYSVIKRENYRIEVIAYRAAQSNPYWIGMLLLKYSREFGVW